MLKNKDLKKQETGVRTQEKQSIIAGMSGKTKHYDIVIVGGGVVGLATAALLARSTLKILVLEKNAPPSVSNQIDLQQRAINHAAQKVLEDIGVWSQLTLGVYQKMHVWDADGAAEIHFDCDDIGRENLGHIASYQAVHLALYQHLTSNTQVEMLYEMSPSTLSNLGELHRLQLSDGRVLTAALCVGADGKNSWLRQESGILSVKKHYTQKALVANIEITHPHQNTAWQQFLPGGPLAFLPLKNAHECAIVWSLPHEEASRLLGMDDASFKESLAAAMNDYFGGIKKVSIRKAFPLNMQYAKQYVQEGIALVGDAAHVIHPLAGLGLNLGLQDAHALAEMIVNAQEKAWSIRALSTLRPYERCRKADNLKALHFVDFLGEFFAKDHRVLMVFRQEALHFLQHFSAIKYHFVQEALG